MAQKIDIKQVAELARLNLKPEEQGKLEKDLNAILAYVEQLQELNTQKVEPTSHVLPLENVFRKDLTKPVQIREQVFKHAPKREGKFFKVPKVIEGA